jgi:release factor glutamine methyltransferase
MVFDLILANPPYMTEAELAEATPELHHEPESALAAGPDGLEAYRALGPLIAGILAPEGRALVEIGVSQAAKVAKILEAAGLEIEAVSPDLSGIPRCIAARGRSGAQSGHQKTVGNRGSGM